jgi:dipeptidase E
MKLFLTSAGLPKETRKYFLELLGKNPHDCTAAFIPTAADMMPKKYSWILDSSKKELTDIGIKTFDIDLKKETKISLRQKLHGSDIIYVMGGNTFYLMHWVRKSGFDGVVKELLSQKIYLGVSAGSIIVGPEIESASWGSNGDKNTVKIKDKSGLNLVPFSIYPHFKKDDLSMLKEETKKLDNPIVALTDKQAIIINGKSIKVVGTGKKVFFNGFCES